MADNLNLQNNPVSQYASECSGRLGYSHVGKATPRSEEHTSELQSRPHISYAVFCLKKKK